MQISADDGAEVLWPVSGTLGSGAGLGRDQSTASPQAGPPDGIIKGALRDELMAPPPQRSF